MANNKIVKLSAVGDIGLIGKVASNINCSGVHQPFSLVSDYLSESDVVFGNLEMPFSEEGIESLQSFQSKNFYHQDNVVQSLQHANFSMLSIANNHIMECGNKGLDKTIKILDSNNIHHIGAGVDLDDARKGAILDLNELKIGFLGYSMLSTDCASQSKPGPAPIILDNINEDVLKLKKKVDFVIVSLHFGMMYMETPTPEDIKICHTIIDSGADVILGHHPHVLQGIERYNEGVIFYSLGEFVFDRKSGVRFVELGSENRRNSIIAELIFEKNQRVKFNLIPTYLNDEYQVEIVSKEEFQTKIDEIDRLSLKLLDTDEFYKEAGSKLVGYELGGLIHHLKKGSFRYVFSKLSNLRIKHFKLLFGFIRSKITF